MSAEAGPAPVAQIPPELIFRLVSQDGTEFKISEKAAHKSETFSNFVSSMEYTPEDIQRNPAFPVGQVNSAELGLVVKWCEEHKDDPDPVDDRNIVISEFDAQLMDVDNDLIFDLVIAANFLNIKGLLYVCCKKIADMVKGKPCEEMRIIYDIPLDEKDKAEEEAAAIKLADDVRKAQAEKAAAEKAAAEKAAARKAAAEKAAAEKAAGKEVAAKEVPTTGGQAEDATEEGGTTGGEPVSEEGAVAEEGATPGASAAAGGEATEEEGAVAEERADTEGGPAAGASDVAK